jgi:hypothetical protein
MIMLKNKPTPKPQLKKELFDRIGITSNGFSGYDNRTPNSINIKSTFDIKKTLLNNYTTIDDKQLNQILDINDKCFIKNIDRAQNSPYIKYFIYSSYYIIESKSEIVHFGNHNYSYDIKLHNITDSCILYIIKTLVNNASIKSFLEGSHPLCDMLKERSDRMTRLYLTTLDRLDKKELEYQQLYDENDKLIKELTEQLLEKYIQIKELKEQLLEKDRQIDKLTTINTQLKINLDTLIKKFD